MFTAVAVMFDLSLSSQTSVVHRSWSVLNSFVLAFLSPKRRVIQSFFPPEARFFARDVLKTRAVEMGSEVLMQAYRNLRNKINRENDRLKRDYFSRKIYENDGNIKGLGTQSTNILTGGRRQPKFRT